MSKISKFFIFIFLLNTVVVGCSKGNGSKNGKPTSEAKPSSNPSNAEDEIESSKQELASAKSKLTPAEVLIKKVSELEEQLKKYGVHIKEEEFRSNGRDGRYDHKYVKVTLKTTAQDSDLIAIGLDPLDRDKLFEKFSMLIEEVESQNLRNHNNATNVAILKIELVRSQVILPKLVGLYEEVLLAKANPGVLEFSESNSVQFLLWDVDTIKGKSLSNGEVTKQLTAALELESKFNAIKSPFLEKFIQRQIEISDIEANSRDAMTLIKQSQERSKLIEFLRKIGREELFKPGMSTFANDLKDKVVNLPPEKPFDPEILRALNLQAIERERTSRFERLEREVNHGMGRLGLAFTTDNQIEPKSLSTAKINNYDFDVSLANTKGDTSRALSEFQSFAGAFKNKNKFTNEEKLILKRAKALLSI